MDVRIAVGILRFGLNLQRKEIQTLLTNRDIHISTGEISWLSDEFLLRWSMFNEDCRSKTANHLKDVVLLADGTQQSGGGTTYRAIEAEHGITLQADHMVSENEDDLVLFFDKLKNIIPKPVAIVRDMSKAAKAALDRVFPKTPQQICHFHFIRDVGETLLKTPYKNLRQAMLNTKELASLARTRKDIIKQGGPQEGAKTQEMIRYAVGIWVRLFIEHVEEARKRTSGFPFKLAYLDVYDECRRGLALVDRMFRSLCEMNVSVPILVELKDKLEVLVRDQRVVEAAIEVGRFSGWLLRVRKVMRLERAGLGVEAVEDGREVRREDVMKVVFEIRSESARLGPDWERRWGLVDSRFKAHEDELWVYSERAEVPRVTNELEGRHRELRRGIRRRTGQEATRGEMERLGDLLSYWANASNKEFVELCVDGVDIWGVFMAQDPVRIRQGVRRLRAKRSFGRLPVAPKARFGILEDLVGLLEGGGGLSQVFGWSRGVEGAATAD